MALEVVHVKVKIWTALQHANVAGTCDKPCKNKVSLKSISHFLFYNLFRFIQNCYTNMYAFLFDKAVAIL